ncbi:MAG: CTP synthase [Eubacteriales bacterium]|nr:CTP synthase [Eubacteriales bacterium]
MATKYIFVTGGVVSGIGKGITAATLGCLLKARGLNVLNQKFDPYINIDPGLMSPTQHGEVFITDDGAETDLDIGHYERFTDTNLDSTCDITTGMIYRDILQREREGGFSGTTVQVVPHIINEIKKHIYQEDRLNQPDVLIAEVGGTVGDMESTPYMEAIRQISYEVGHENVLFIHVTLIPYLRSSGETKTKPTQHSVQKLRSLGIQPDILVCRCEKPLDDDVISKIALYCNVEKSCVIQNIDVETVYHLPLTLEAEGLAKEVIRKLSLPVDPDRPADLSQWQSLIVKDRVATKPIRIALVGKYLALQDAYISVLESLRHAGIANGVKADIKWVDAEDLTDAEQTADLLSDVAAIIIPGGFGPRGMAGMIQAAAYALDSGKPMLGIGLGMQMATVAFARNRAGLEDAHSAESETACTPLFTLPNSETNNDLTSSVLLNTIQMQRRSGTCPSRIQPDTRLAAAYCTQTVDERHHHRWEFNSAYRDVLAEAGLVFAGLSPDERLVEAVEVADHPWYIGVVYHPEFRSRPIRPHPLFTAFLKAAEEASFVAKASSEADTQTEVR